MYVKSKPRKIKFHPAYTYERYGQDNTLVISHTFPVAKPEWFPFVPKQQVPRKKDQVSYRGRYGIVLWRDSEDAYVKFFDDGFIEPIGLDSFHRYTTKGGKTQWIIT